MTGQLQTKIKGRARVLGDSIDTDMITPGKYLAIIEPKGLAQHLLEGYDEGFPSSVEPGDILITGQNFGCGSSREHAVAAMRGAEIGCVAGESFARIFYRNCLNLAQPILEIPDVTKHVKEGDAVEIDLTAGTLTNLRSNEVVKGYPMSEKAVELLEAGGLINVVRRKLHARGSVDHEVAAAPAHANHRTD